MKLDLGDAFTHIYEEGNARVRLDLQSEAIPTNKEGLQKCALIVGERWGDAEDGYDMMMLDRQNKGSGGADFWHKSFFGGNSGAR